MILLRLHPLFHCALVQSIESFLIIFRVLSFIDSDWHYHIAETRRFETENALDSFHMNITNAIVLKDDFLVVQSANTKPPLPQAPPPTTCQTGEESPASQSTAWGSRQRQASPRFQRRCRNNWWSEGIRIFPQIGKEKTIWFNCRQEPVAYVGGHSVTARSAPNTQ